MHAFVTPTRWLALVALGCLAGSVRADTLANYTFASNTSSTDTETNSTASAFSHDFKAGTGTETADVGRSSTKQDYFVRGNKTDGSDEATTVAAEDYMTFTVTPATGYELDLTSLSFEFSLSRDNTSPDIVYPADNSVFVRSSVDGFATTIPSSTGTRTLATSGSTYPTTALTIAPSLTGSAYQSIKTTVEFRIYIYDDQTTSQLISRIDDVQLTGDVDKILAPGTVVLMR